ncbi:MAG: uroporphyrinogen decarboxylase family protein [Kiritimatiellia bacterium]|nr:uroporphyrinogen decarboxylase family protein [Kiritimatiellia bacterium]
MKTEREIFLENIRLQGDGLVPCAVSVAHGVWVGEKERLEALKAECPNVTFSMGRYDEKKKAGKTWRDEWGCLWRYEQDYLEGQVVEHPLADWQAFAAYRAPDPGKRTDWEKERTDSARTKKAGDLLVHGPEHGFLFLKLTYLRGFENLMLDIGEQNPNLPRLIRVLADYWYEVVKRWVGVGADFVSFADDLGLQHALPISPSAWREYIKPTFKKLFSFCREHGVEVGLHTDGYIVDIIPDLVECGVSSLNPQDIVNGLENIKRLAKGKIHINLDIDRQKITAFGKPAEINAHVKDCISELGSPNGGLSLIYGAYPGTSIENVAAVARAMEQYRTMHA